MHNTRSGCRMGINGRDPGMQVAAGLELMGETLRCTILEVAAGWELMGETPNLTWYQSLFNLRGGINKGLNC